MKAGALGVTTALIYPPNAFAHTEELIALAKVAGQYRGKYIAHIRSEANQLVEKLMDETIRIAREAHVPVEIYHLKASGEANWPKMDQVIHRIEQARQQGVKISADMYTYTAGSTGLTSTMPWALDGGYEALYKRLRDHATRAKIAAEMRTPTQEWENMFLLPGSLDRILLVGFKSEKLKPLTGKTLAEVAKMRGQDPTDTVMDLILEDQSRIQTIYFMMSEENIKKQIAQPWVSFWFRCFLNGC